MGTMSRLGSASVSTARRISPTRCLTSPGNSSVRPLRSNSEAGGLPPDPTNDGHSDAAITYLDDCFSTIADGEPGQSYADTPIGSYIPSRYEQYYDGRFARRRSGRERPLLQRACAASAQPTETGKPCS
jgi:hypothetical protein